jgi:YHS domain-containing protein
MIALLLATLLTAQAPKPATNTKCPVLGSPTDASSPTVVVRGQTYRYCCAGCSGQLMANPDKYLNKDGTPKNAK